MTLNGSHQERRDCRNGLVQQRRPNSLLETSSSPPTASGELADWLWGFVELDATEIRSLFDELAARLPPDEAPSIIVITGGALLALRGIRSATTDIDSISRLSPVVRTAVAAVAQYRDLDPSWLNNRAQAFTPATFDESTCELELARAQLVVLGISMRDLFLMKLHAARDRDLEDLERLWPRSGFGSAEQAVDSYYLAYPDEPVDEFLKDFVGQIANRAERR